jgi:hypothetical protein
LGENGFEVSCLRHGGGKWFSLQVDRREFESELFERACKFDLEELQGGLLTARDWSETWCEIVLTLLVIHPKKNWENLKKLES